MSIRPPLSTSHCKLPTSAHPKAEAASLAIAARRSPPAAPPAATFKKDDHARVAGVKIAVEACEGWSCALVLGPTSFPSALNHTCKTCLTKCRRAWSLQSSMRLDEPSPAMTNGSKRPRGTTDSYSSTVVVTSIALASSLVLHWHRLPHCAGVFAQHFSPCSIVVIPGLVVINCVGRHCHLWRSMPSFLWHLCWCCAGIVSLMALVSLASLHLRHHPCHAGVCLLATSLLHRALLLCWCCCCTQLCCCTYFLQPHHHLQCCCCTGFVIVHSLIAIHGIVIFICGGCRRSTMPPAAAADGLGLSDA
jgi:hypothetical protein